MTQLAVTGLYKSFGDNPVLAGVDLEVPAGSLTAILGPSGSGKTTLLRVLAGFERADAGTVTIGSSVVDDDGVHVPPEQRRIGYVPQEGGLFPHLTVAANIGFGLSRRDRRDASAAELLDAVGLAGLGQRYPHQLSGGQQQRVALARALAIRPKVVLLDEPFASLDAHLRASVRSDVQQLLKAAGTTAVLVTHDQDEALSTADRVAVLRDGQIAQCATPLELYARPVDADLAAFIGDANLVEGTLGGGTVDTVLGQLAVQVAGTPAAAGPAVVLIRPEQIELWPAGRQPPDQAGPDSAGRDGAPRDSAGRDGADGCLRGRVIAYGYHGHDAVIRVQPENRPDAAPVLVRTVGGQQLAPGSQVRLRARGPVLAWPAVQPGGPEVSSPEARSGATGA